MVSLLGDGAVAAVEVASGWEIAFGKFNMEEIGFVMCCVFVALVCKVIIFAAHICKARKRGLRYTLGFVHELENVSYISTLLFRWEYSEYLMQGDLPVMMATFPF